MLHCLDERRRRLRARSRHRRDLGLHSDGDPLCSKRSMCRRWWLWTRALPAPRSRRCLPNPDHRGGSWGNRIPVRSRMDMLEFMERMSPPLRGSHCFLGHAFSGDQRDIWQWRGGWSRSYRGCHACRATIDWGKCARRRSSRRYRRVRSRIFDITEDRLNSCIEAGVARGAGVKYELVCVGRADGPPFLFRDKQVFFYDTPTELLGQIRKLVWSFVAL